MILALLVVMLSCGFTFAHTAMVTALPDEKIIAIDETAAFDVYGCYSDNTSQLQEGENTNCQWKYVGATAYSDEQCTTEDSTVVSATTTADTEWATQKCYEKNVTIKGLKAGVNWVKFRMKYRLDTTGEGTEVISNAVKVIVYDVGFIDNIPDYSLTSNKDSDNFFLRQHDAGGTADYKNLDIYYYILPDVLTVSNVKITIRKEDKIATNLLEITGEKKADGNYKTGNELHVKWSDVRDAAGNFRNNRFYTVQLEVDIKGVEETFKTPLGDADATMPGYQCKEKCLVIHDLVFKHRPVVNMGANEVVAPNGPVYPFSDKIIANYRLLKKYPEIDIATGEERPEFYDIDVAWSAPPPNYSDFGTFPNAPPMPQRLAFMYSYPVLEASIEQGGEDAYNHFIQIKDQNRNCADGNATLFHRGHVSEGHGGGNYCFIQFWMYETASYAPYNVPIFGNSFWHEGDWEMVQSCIKLTGTTKSKWFLPYAATASQHYYGQTLAWRINKNGPECLAQEYVSTEDNGNRIKVYIAQNSHATYFKTGSIKTNSLKCGTQIQYEPVSWYRDTIDVKVKPVSYALIPLNHKDDCGIADWTGQWGKDGTMITFDARAPYGPFWRAADMPNGVKLNLNGNPAKFHNLCRKLIDGTPQPETGL
jgi:hypothetical protein